MTEMPNSVYYAVVRNLQRSVGRIQVLAIILADLALIAAIALRIMYGPTVLLSKYVIVWGIVMLFNALVLWLNPSSSWLARRSAVHELSKYTSGAHDQLLADVELQHPEASLHKEAHDLIRIAHKKMYAPADRPFQIGRPTALRLIVLAIIGAVLTGMIVAQTGWSAFLLMTLDEWTSTIAAAAISISLFIMLRKQIMIATRTRAGTALFCGILIVLTGIVCWIIVLPSGGFTQENLMLMLKNLLQALAFVAATFVTYRFLAFGWKGIVPFAKPKGTQ